MGKQQKQIIYRTKSEIREFFKAKVDIKKDTQLLISYSEEYWEDGYREMAK
jgi:hypothetical protein